MPRTAALFAAALLAAAVSASPSVGATRVIDLSGSAWPAIAGAQAEEQFGYAVDAGDLDGDGRPEIVVGAPGHRSGTAYHAGAVYVFGGAADLTGRMRAADEALFVITGAEEQGRFGASLAVLDADGDGLDDLVVGAPSEGAGGQIDRGSVYVFRSRRGEPPPVTARGADAVLRGEAAGDGLGTSLLAADVDGDGRDDLVASAFHAGGPSKQAAGAVYVLWSATLRDARGESDVARLADAVLTGDRPGDSLRGLAVGSIGGGPGPDLIVGACLSDGPAGDRPDAGALFVVPAERLAAGGRSTLSAAATGSVTGGRERGFLGRSIAAGDLDADGVDDLLMAAYASGGETKDANVTGEAFVLFASASAPVGHADLRTANVTTFRGLSRWDLFGFAALLADMNGDGPADIVLTAPFAGGDGEARPRCGEVYVFWGGLRSVVRAKGGAPELADVRIVGAAAQDALGGAVAAVRGGGRKTPDLLIGAPDAASPPACGERCGKVFIVSGRAVTGRGE